MSEKLSRQENIWTQRDVEKVVTDLRCEVEGQKECITRYSFQAIAFAAVVWGLVLKGEGHLSGIPFYLCGTITVFLLLTVVRMANHKYSTVNRNLGYELHLSRMKDYTKIEGTTDQQARLNWAKNMMAVGWEEAMCAWRVVQPTIFDFLYTPVLPLLPQRISNAKVHREAQYKWYSTPQLLAKGTTYHPGNYLRNIHNMLHFLVAASLIAMWGMFWSQADTKAYTHILRWEFFVSSSFGIPLLLFGTTVFFISQFIRQTAGRKIRERELLSIQSSAVVWRVVITCHILAVEWITRENKSYQGYTKALSCLALNVNNNFYTVHSWLKDWEATFFSENLHAQLKQIIAPDSKSNPQQCK